MKCKTKSSIKVDAQRAMPHYDINSMRKGSLTGKQLIAEVEDTMGDIHMDNYAERAADRNLLGKALRRVRGLLEHGLIISDTNNHIAQATSGFLNNVVRNKDHALDLLNRLNFDGTYSGEAKPIFTKDEWGRAQSEHSVEKLNNMIKSFIGKRLVPRDNYVTQGKKGLIVSANVQLDINEYYYNTYQQRIGILAGDAIQFDQNTPPEYLESISQMRTVPIVAHINSQISALRTSLKRLKDDKSVPYSPAKATAINTSISEHVEKREAVKESLGVEMLQQYYEDVLRDIEHDLNPNNNVQFSEDALQAYLQALKLIERTANREHEDNPVLEFTETRDKALIKSMDKYANDAKDLRIRLNEVIYSKIHDIVRDNVPGDYDDEKLTIVPGLSGWFGRFSHLVLGLHQIDNPIVQFIHKKITGAESAAFLKASKENKKLEKYYKDMKSTGFDTKNFYQENEEGLSNGRMVDVFSSKWFKDEALLYGKYNLGKLSQEAKFTRHNHVITLNPQILFGEAKTAAEKKVKQDLYDSIYDSMGKEHGQIRIDEAERLWDMYTAAEESQKERLSPEEFTNWELTNSPIKRLQNFKRTDTNHGTDRFLLLIPKRVDSDGDDLGYHDDKFEKIQSNDAAKKFYNFTRHIFIKNQEAMYNYDEKFHPPTLAYIGKSIAELASAGDWGSAASLWRKDTAKKYSLKEKIYKRKYPKDPITGENQAHLKMEIHSIPVEVQQRVNLLLANDVEYKLLAEDKVKGNVKRAAIKDKYYMQVYKEVEAERSEDLLQSVIMSNFATHTFIQKNVIETSIKLAKHILESNKVKVVGEGDESTNDARKMLENQLDHFINHSFYDVRNQEGTTTFKTQTDLEEGEEGEQVETSAVTLRSVTSGLQSYMRATVLGWSAMHAVLNIGQQFFSSVMKAGEKGQFSYMDLFKGYGNYIQASKNRKLIDRLFIVGDVAYAYKKRSIHETGAGRLWSKTNPMFIQTFAEKFNQGSVSLAVMHSLKVTDAAGKELSLYDALDDEGELDTQYTHKDYKDTGDDLLVKLTIDRIRPVVMATAGDYLNPLYAERNELGKMALMFKKWLPEMLQDRLHKKSYNYALQKETEGRLRAFTAASLQIVTGQYSTLVKDQVRMDAARAGLYEVLMATVFRMLYIALGKMACDTPECKSKQGPTLMAMNMLGRLVDDVQQLATPWSALNQIANPIAAEGIVKDVWRLKNDLESYLVPGGDTGKYTRNSKYHKKGDLKYINKLEKLIPFYRTNFFNYKNMSRKLSYDATLYGAIRVNNQPE